MPIKVCSSKPCSRPFQLNAYTFQNEIALQPGKITCPNCGAVMHGNIAYVFSTHALSKNQEKQYSENCAELISGQNMLFDMQALNS